MALKPVHLLLLWGLTLTHHGVMSFCNVTCSTDYSTVLNCSCSSVPTRSVTMNVSCSDGNEAADGSCEVVPPQSWCVMYPDRLDDIADATTMCTSTASQQADENTANCSESSSWPLRDVVKPPPPFHIEVADAEEFYNITWDHENEVDHLMYRVRIRETKDLSKNVLSPLLVYEKHVVVDQRKFSPGVNYTVDVMAKMAPGNLYQGPWSEWSSSAHWRTPGGINVQFLYIPLSIISLLALLVLAYAQKPFWQKKLQIVTYVPNPEEFFKPLYHNYGGNFKEWVKAGFSEYDYVQGKSQAAMKSEEHHDILQRNIEMQICLEDDATMQSPFHPMLQPHSNRLLCQESRSSQGTSHSIGHISIHTVTLSGELDSEEEVVSQSSNSLRLYQDGDSLNSFGGDHRALADYNPEEPQLSRPERQSGVSLHHENQISNNLSLEDLNFEPRLQLDEPERESLDSFGFNEQSDDGYPHVDLDTIDSGFGECGSPGVSDSNIAEQIVAFQEHKSSNSNYVKQWMACSIMQEDCSNSENEFHQM